jgi:opacity protein-like surface antigen
MFKKILCASLILAAAGAAQAGNPGFYVGAGAGQARYDDNLPEQIRAAYLGNTGYSFTSADLTDDTGQAWKVFGGYRFLPWLGVEFGWVDLGEVRSNFVLRSLVPLTNASANIDGRYNVAGPSATVFGELDFNDRLSGILRVGYFNARFDYDESGTSAAGRPHSFSNSEDSGGLTYGLGLNVAVTPNWDVRLDWDRYRDVGNRFALTNEGNGRFEHIDMVSMNVAYRFGQ